ncbi:hypothetical protein GGQ88_004068 [Novosphingobium hassiacum]|uniref:ATP-binding protein n=1 Tax=Novosphingobium hassiacum TaxID=173676 RepID=A0A7W6A0A2_9SPHN|nr:ATP-binding protein [Novosphingobium hassiacum]MBB3862766.1 hypothetical protein [Novosphingobium hassiacum]
MNTATKLRARVSPEAISKVTRIFNGSLGDIFGELLQNSRRAGATTIAISALHLEEACVITVSDDGAGIDDPANLVSLGQSDWSDECCAREDPAGMGFFSLAGRDTVVSSASATASFSLAISGPAWTGEADIDVLPFQGPRGTTISFTFDAIRDGHLDRAVKAAALHFPLPVTYNDEPLPRVDFLAGAHAVIEREGYRIGVYRQVNLDHVPTINFHGLTLRHKLPSIKEVHHTLWRVKVDIIDAPELVLVLPARKEIYHNPALDRLMEICNEAIYAAINKEPFHRLAHKDWLAARLAGRELPEAARQLPSWQGHCARDSYHEIANYAEIDPTAALYDDGDACDSVTFGRALAFSHGEDCSIDSNRLIAPADITFFAAVPPYQGYSWYDALSCYVQTGVTYRQHDGSETACETDAVTFRPDVLTIELTDQHDKRLDLLSDFAIQEGENCWSGADEARIALTRTASIDPGDLTELIIDAVFSPSDDSDADSYDTQETRFRHDAAVRAHAILEGEDAAIIAGIRMAFADRVAWRIPHGRTLQLTWSSEYTSLELRAAKDAKPQ